MPRKLPVKDRYGILLGLILKDSQPRSKDEILVVRQGWFEDIRKLAEELAPHVNIAADLLDK